MKRLFSFVVLIILITLIACSPVNGADESGTSKQTETSFKKEKAELKPAQISQENELLFSLVGDPFLLFEVNIRGKKEKEFIILADHYIDGEKQEPATMLSEMITDNSKKKVAIFHQRVGDKCQWVSAIFTDDMYTTYESDPTICNLHKLEHISSIEQAEPIDIAMNDEEIVATYHFTDSLDEPNSNISLSDHKSDIPTIGETFIIKTQLRDQQ